MIIAYRILLFGLCVVFMNFAGEAQTDTITIIHINDSHTDLVPFAGGTLGGVARAASVIGQWKATEPNPILVHSGDFTVGSLMYNRFFGVPDLQIMNSLGFDALCLGNHEFDAGDTALAGIFGAASLDTSFHILCTNALNVQAFPLLEPVIKPSAIITRNGLKIGLVALTTPAANIESSPAPIFIDTNVVQDAMAEVASLRGAGCTIVILLSHLGLSNDEGMASYLSGVDAIIGGHSHDALSSVVTVNGIPIVQAGSFFRYVGRLRLVYNGSTTSVLDYTLQEITEAVPPEPTIDAMVEQLKDSVRQSYAPVLGDPYAPIGQVPHRWAYAPTSIVHPKSELGDTLTMAMLYSPFASGFHPQCAIEATGHMAEDIYAGPVTPADVFRAYPYGFDPSDGLGFRLASFELTGAQIQGVLQALLGYVHPEANDFEYVIQSTGLNYSVDTTGGTLTLANLTIAGEPVQSDSLYRFVGSDRLLGYLGALFGITPTNPTVYPVSVLSVLLNRLKQVVGSVDEGRLPEEFRLEQNYPNPFNPSTTIRFSIEHTGSVTLKIYSILGQPVATPVDGQLAAGSHQVVWDARGKSSGVYFYQLKAGSSTATKKMILMR